MDTLAHGLWAAAAAKVTNRTVQKKLRTGWMVFWGVMPDLVSFTPAIGWMLWLVLMKGVHFSEVPRPELLPPEVRAKFFIFRLTNVLYHPTHSLVIFACIFLLVWAVRWYRLNYYRGVRIPTVTSTPAAPPGEMCGWLLHILLDIPSHTTRLYPTPFLWPLSDFTVDGISWGRPWFMALNYGALLTVFIVLTVRSGRKRRKTAAAGRALQENRN
jgi:hypothetical protein